MLYIEIKGTSVKRFYEWDEKIIKSCFDFCTPEVKKEVKKWLESSNIQPLVLEFNDKLVRLEK